MSQFSTPASATQHPDYSQIPRPIVLQAEGVKFTYDLNRILVHSEALLELFSMPPNAPTSQVEGTDQYPLVLPVTSNELERFLKWMDHTNWNAPENTTEEDLVVILKICKMWIMRDGMNFAIYHLERKTLSPARRLELAQEYSIHSWIREAVEELMMTSILTLSDDDIKRIGIHAFQIIMKAKESLEQYRRRCAWMPPELPNSSLLPDSCSAVKHVKCQHIWKESWLKMFPRLFFDPTAPLPFSQVLNRVHDMELAGINLACKEMLINHLESSGFLSHASSVTTRVVDRIIAECCAM